jgi:hypothetical protein
MVAPEQSALLELLEARTAADVDDRIRTDAATVCQALIEAELSSVIGALPHARTETHRVCATGFDPRRSPRRPGSGVAEPDVAFRLVLSVALGTVSAGRSVAVRGDHGGVSARHLDAQGRQPGQSARCGQRHQQERGRPGSAPSSTSRWLRSAAGPCLSSRSGTCSSMPCAAKPESTIGSCPGGRGGHRGRRRRAAGGTRLRRQLGRGRRRLAGLSAAWWPAGYRLVTSDAHAGLKAAIEAVLLGAVGRPRPGAAGLRSRTDYRRSSPR